MRIVQKDINYLAVFLRHEVQKIKQLQITQPIKIKLSLSGQFRGWDLDIVVLEYVPSKISTEVTQFARKLETTTGANVFVVAGRLHKMENQDAWYTTFGSDVVVKDKVSFKK